MLAKRCCKPSSSPSQLNDSVDDTWCVALFMSNSLYGRQKQLLGTDTGLRLTIWMQVRMLIERVWQDHMMAWRTGHIYCPPVVRKSARTQMGLLENTPVIIGIVVKTKSQFLTQSSLRQILSELYAIKTGLTLNQRADQYVNPQQWLGSSSVLN